MAQSEREPIPADAPVLQMPSVDDGGAWFTIVQEVRENRRRIEENMRKADRERQASK